jgi:hypothetical protein
MICCLQAADLERSSHEIGAGADILTGLGMI